MWDMTFYHGKAVCNTIEKFNWHREWYAMLNRHLINSNHHAASADAVDASIVFDCIFDYFQYETVVTTTGVGNVVYCMF